MKVTYRSLRARAARAGLHAPVAWLRHFGLHSNDVFIASHGRSGTTALRFILAEILSGEPSTFDNIQQISPEMGLQGRARAVLPGGGRLIKTHEPYRREYRHKRAIYMVRDVRDSILSAFARETAVDCIHCDMASYVRPFMQGKVTHFGSYQKHVDSWLNSPLAKSGDLLVLRFEDMVKDIEHSVGLCLEFLGAPAERPAIQAAIRNNSLEKMRAKEDRSIKFPKVKGEEGRQVGKGKVGSWREKLTQHELEIIDELAGDTLARLGYASSIGNGSQGRTPAAKMTQQLDFSNTRIRRPETNSTGNKAQDSGVNQALRIRVGGQIANFFCWYHY